MLVRHIASVAKKQQHFDCIVIGAGIVGLACGYQYLLRSRVPKSVLVVDSNSYTCFETSSRNSEVIHAGLYYPLGSLKTELCIRGKHMLYEFCERYRVPHKRVGKWVVASPHRSGEIEYLSGLHKKAMDLGIPTRMLSRKELEQEPLLRKDMLVMQSDSTGIVDSHGLSSALEGRLSDMGGQVFLKTRVIGIQFDRQDGVYYVRMKHVDDGRRLRRSVSEQEEFNVSAQHIINSGGLWAYDVARSLHDGIDTLPVYVLESYQTAPLKGFYYTMPNPVVSGSSTRLVNRLIYPVPPDPVGLTKGLGIHCTVDLTGRLRLGPNAEPAIGNTDYHVDMEPSDAERARRHKFFESISGYLDVRESDFEQIKVDYAGLRPKLKPLPGQKGRDFVIQEEGKHGFPGFVNLVGIESPGLTACLAIGEHVANVLK